MESENAKLVQLEQTLQAKDDEIQQLKSNAAQKISALEFKVRALRVENANLQMAQQTSALDADEKTAQLEDQKSKLHNAMTSFSKQKDALQLELDTAKESNKDNAVEVAQEILSLSSANKALELQRAHKAQELTHIKQILDSIEITSSEQSDSDSTIEMKLQNVVKSMQGTIERKHKEALVLRQESTKLKALVESLEMHEAAKELVAQQKEAENRAEFETRQALEKSLSDMTQRLKTALHQIEGERKHNESLSKKLQRLQKENTQPIKKKNSVDSNNTNILEHVRQELENKTLEAARCKSDAANLESMLQRKCRDVERLQKQVEKLQAETTWSQEQPVKITESSAKRICDVCWREIKHQREPKPIHSSRIPTRPDQRMTHIDRMHEQLALSLQQIARMDSRINSINSKAKKPHNNDEETTMQNLFRDLSRDLTRACLFRDESTHLDVLAFAEACKISRFTRHQPELDGLMHSIMTSNPSASQATCPVCGTGFKPTR